MLNGTFALISSAFNLFLSAVWAKFIRRILPRRDGWQGSFWFAYLLMAAWLFFGSAIYNAFYIKIPANILIGYLASHACCRGAWSKKALASVSISGAIATADIVAVLIVISLSGKNGFLTLQEDPALNILAVMISAIVDLLALDVISKLFINNLTLKASYIVRFALLFGSQYMSLFLFFHDIIFTGRQHNLMRSRSIGLGVLVVFLVVDIIILRAARGVMVSNMHHERHELVQKERSALIARYNELEVEHTKYLKLRHDINNHLGTVQAFFIHSDFEAAETYSQQLLILFQEL